MEWDVEYTDEFGRWWAGLSESEQESVDAYVELLETAGASVLYAFGPRRTAILLMGGDKTGDDRWYQKFVPLADALYDRHLEELRGGVDRWLRSSGICAPACHPSTGNARTNGPRRCWRTCRSASFDRPGI